MLNTGIRNALTVDVEDYFQVSAFAPYISRASWDTLECRIEANIDKILQIFSDGDAKATFFTLGWIADRYPSVVRRIIDDGHELASHGFGHERVTDLNTLSFAEDIERAKKTLEDISGKSVVGYRAPSFSIGSNNLWVFDSLAEAGYKYSSSIYPIVHDHYGMPDSPRFAYRLPNGILEVPVTTVRLLNKNLPSSGGGYFRLLPYTLSRWMLTRVNRVDMEAAVFYFHPWEIDALQPRVENIDLRTRFRHYVNISKMSDRVQRLLGDFSWGRMDDIFMNRRSSLPMSTETVTA
jgi:polysaccharide deacetylase family protein (PEP-CTERM system associated)